MWAGLYGGGGGGGGGFARQLPARSQLPVPAAALYGSSLGAAPLAPDTAVAALEDARAAAAAAARDGDRDGGRGEATLEGKASRTPAPSLALGECTGLVRLLLGEVDPGAKGVGGAAEAALVAKCADFLRIFDGDGDGRLSEAEFGKLLRFCYALALEPVSECGSDRRG